MLMTMIMMIVVMMETMICFARTPIICGSRGDSIE
jgi:hypothetical protein